jgi:hypothetical protein
MPGAAMNVIRGLSMVLSEITTHAAADQTCAPGRSAVSLPRRRLVGC